MKDEKDILDPNTAIVKSTSDNIEPIVNIEHGEDPVKTINKTISWNPTIIKEDI